MKRDFRSWLTTLNRPLVPAGLMFICFGFIAVLAAQPEFGLGVPSPRTGALASRGLLTGAGRLLGISRLSHGGLTALYFSLLLVLFASYVWAIILVWRKRKQVSKWFIIGSFAVFSLWLLFLPPLLSQDLYAYISYGKTITVYGKNPYLAAPGAFPQDPLTAYVGWKNTVSIYGPLLNYLSALLVLVSGKTVVSNVIAFKLVNFAFLVGSLFLLDDLAGRLLDDKRSVALLIVAWNPLIIIHLVGGGHNDPIMIFLILLGLLLYKKDYPVLAIALIVLAAMVKVIAVLVLVPVLVLFLREHAKWKFHKYLEALAALVVLPLVLYLPLWAGLDKHLSAILGAQKRLSSSSVQNLVRSAVAKVSEFAGVSTSTGSSVGTSVSRVLFLVLFVLLFALLCYMVRDYRSLIFSCGAIALISIFTTAYVMPWYVCWALFLVVLSGSRLWTGTALATTFVLSFYVRTINVKTGTYIPIPLLLIAIVLMLGVIRERRLVAGTS